MTARSSRTPMNEIHHRARVNKLSHSSDLCCSGTRAPRLAPSTAGERAVTLSPAAAPRAILTSRRAAGTFITRSLITCRHQVAVTVAQGGHRKTEVEKTKELLTVSGCSMLNGLIMTLKNALKKNHSPINPAINISPCCDFLTWLLPY